MTLTYTVRPISDRLWLRPASERERSRFTASWTDTLDLLGRELDHLDASNVVFEMDVREHDIRVDGQVRANARPSSDAVAIAFESVDGPVIHHSDLYDAVAWGARNAQPWQHNIRAIALTLEALRAVGRYGASRNREQYRGYKAIGAGDGTAPSGMTTDLAREILQAEAGPAMLGATWPSVVRAARGNAHPDRNAGDRSRWDAVEQAVQVLKRAGDRTGTDA